MIRIIASRERFGEIFSSPEHLAQPYEALRTLAVNELGFGGSLTGIETGNGQTSVTVVTPIMHCIDTTVFSGSDKDLGLLIDFLSCYAAVFQTRDADRMSEAILAALNRSTLLLISLGPIIYGSSEVFAALVVWAGLETDEQVEMARSVVATGTRGGHSGLNELIEVIEFVRELGISFEEACHQVGRVPQVEVV